jgi:hypothetical protein
MNQNINEVKNVINQLNLINDVIQNIISSNLLKIPTSYKNYDNIVLRLLSETSKLRVKVDALDLKVMNCTIDDDYEDPY